MGTDKKLVAAAAALLDAGGEGAVTLRAVGRAVGISHNAPYKHFKDRSALLAAVAVEDFTMLTKAFARARRSPADPLAKLKHALQEFIAYGQTYPARYRLLFNDPKIAAETGELERAALETLAEFAAIVAECQAVRSLPPTPNAALTGLLYASVHGLIDLEAGGRIKREKGFSSVSESMTLLVDLLSNSSTSTPEQ